MTYGEEVALWGFLPSGSYAMCPPGSTLLAQGEHSDTCCLTINGAAEKVIVRGDCRVRVGLAGPGKAFGYEGLIDGLPSPFTAITRERTLLLMLPREPFTRTTGTTRSRGCSSTFCCATWSRRFR